jgi:hypothetical protein
MRIVHLALIAGPLAFLSADQAFSAGPPGTSLEPSQSVQQNPPAAVPAATVIASIPYQVTGATNASCSANSSACTFFFPLIGANRRLDIQFVSCRLVGVGLQVGDAVLGIGDASQVPSHFLNGSDHASGNNTFFVISQPVVFSIPADKRPNIKIFYATTTLLSQRCSISGVLQFLQ